MAPKHSEDFKREALRIATHSGLTRRQVASDLWVGFSTLGKWMWDYSTDPVTAEDVELHRENELLRKENRILMYLQGSANSPGDCSPAARGRF